MVFCRVQLRKDDPMRLQSCVATCGLSLGEYTALAFAGVFSFEDGLRLVKARAEAMQVCVYVHQPAYACVHF